jgi:hypothetical protein
MLATNNLIHSEASELILSFWNKKQE